LRTTRFPRLNLNVIVRGLPMGSFRVPVSVNAPDALTVTLEAPASAVDAVMTSVAICADAEGRLVLMATVLLPVRRVRLGRSAVLMPVGQLRHSQRIQSRRASISGGLLSAANDLQ